LAKRGRESATSARTNARWFGACSAWDSDSLSTELLDVAGTFHRDSLADIQSHLGPYERRIVFRERLVFDFFGESECAAKSHVLVGVPFARTLSFGNCDLQYRNYCC
jgi:hypothetical protein